MRKVILALLVLFSAFGLFVWYAARPAVSPETFPSSGILNFFEGEAPVLKTPPSEIKIVTYNIGYASGEKNNRPLRLSKAEVEGNLGNMAATLKELNPDLLCLQEVDFSASRTFQINQMVFLAKALKMPYGAYVVTWNKRYLPWPYWPLQYQFGRILSGQAVLSRFPIQKQDLLRFEKPASNPFWYNWFYLDRIVQKVTLTFGDKNLDLYNVHLEAFDKSTRLFQAQALGGWVKNGGNPLNLVAGDFNSVSVHRLDLPESQKKELEDGGDSLHDFIQITGMTSAEGNPPFFTMPSWDPLKKIDHILYDPKVMKLISVGTMKVLKASDHLPVWGVVEMKRNIGEKP